MKNLKYIITFLSLALIFSACEEETYEFGDLAAPSDLELTSQIVGVTDANPNGDGSGTVTFTATSVNALAYKFVYNGSETSVPKGVKTFNFVSQTGPIGTFDVSKHVVTIVAYGTGGVSSSTSVEVEVLAPNVPPPIIIEDFEGALPDIGTFGPDGHIGTSYVDNPDKTGINPSSKVVKYIKPSGSQTWAGLFFNNDKLHLDLYSKISVKVWTSKPGIKMLFKLENVNNTASHEMEGSFVSSGKWEEIVFDFSDAPVADYTKIVLFFDIWEVGDDSVYYFDDVRLFN